MMLGHHVSKATVARYMLKRRGRPAQNWKTFLKNHLHETAAIDFLTVPTVTFRTLYVLVVLSLDRRRLVHVNVTTHPTAAWTALQPVQAFPFDTAPRFIIDSSSATASTSTATWCAGPSPILPRGAHASRPGEGYAEWPRGGWFRRLGRRLPG